MFTGLVQAIGNVSSRDERKNLLRLTIESSELAPELRLGASIAVAGVCLTATRLDPPHFQVEVARETLERSKLSKLGAGHRVNLELPLRPDDRLGGHFVQGHIDEVGRIAFAGDRAGNYILRVEHGPDTSALVVEKGSIAIDGVSLTVSGSGRGWLEVMLIPHTLEVTTLSELKPGDEVNLEYDILAKYMAHFAETYRALAGRG